MRLSYSKIKTYLECPLKFYFIYILNMKVKPKSYTSFGKSIHQTLSDFHRLPKYPTFEDLKKIYEKRWIREGYNDIVHEQKEFEKGLILLKKYYNKNIFNYNQAYLVEKMFFMNLKDISIVSIIDRIDKFGEDYEIIEYKTGRSSIEYNSISLLSDDEILQMSIYYLSFKKNFKKDPKSLSIYYLSLDKDEKINIKLDKNIIKEKLKLVINVYNNISSKYFYKKENNNCKFCDFKKECENWKW